MANYKIKVLFNDHPQHDDVLQFDYTAGGELFFFTFVDLIPDTARNPVERGSYIAQTAANFKEAFRIYYNLGGWYSLYTDPANNKQIIIEGNFSSAPVVFEKPTEVTITIETLAPELLITNIGVLENATDTCNLFDLIVTGNHDFTELLEPIQETFPASPNRTVTDLPRDSYVTFIIKDANGETASQTVLTPSFLNLGLINIVIVNNTVTIQDTTRGLVLEYSLDDSNWQPEPVFNLSGGDYILYIRDQYGCKISTTFSLEEGVDGVITIPDPFFFYSKANALRMAKREQWDDVTVFKNSDNTLSCEVQDDVVYTERQRFRSADSIRLQMKNNYADLKVITSNDLVEQTLIKMSDNIGVKSSMDCKIADLGDFKYGIYFIAGDTYDYDTDANLNEPYALNGELPQFGKAGNIITINNFNYEIEETNYNEDVKAFQLVISSAYLVGITDAIVKAIYNIFGYEIYEVDFAVLGRGEFNVEIWYDGQIQYASEIVLVDDISTNLSNIEWSMKYNTDMFFATGIIPRIRVLTDTVKAGAKAESEKYTTDSDVIQVQSDNFEVDVYTFIPVSKEMARKLLLIFVHSNITINGIDYIIDSPAELEPLERSNLYVVKATLLVRGTGLFEDRVGNTNVEVPTLIKTEADEYIKI